MGTARKTKSAKLSQYGVAENGWPLVPCNPDAVPPEYEAIRIDWPKAQERFVIEDNQIGRRSTSMLPEDDGPVLIVKKRRKPIALPITIVPPGWWLVKQRDDQCIIFEKEPVICRHYGSWEAEDAGYFLATPVVKQLPKEWLKLPWEKSKVQQKEK